MKYTIADAVKKTLNKRLTLTNEFISEIRELSESKLSDKALLTRIESVINTIDNVVIDNEFFLYENHENFSFRVFPEELEREKRTIILASLKPFISDFGKAVFVDEKNNEIPFIKKGLAIPYEKSTYYLRYYSLVEIAEDFKFAGDNIILPALNLKDWKYDFNFGKKDTIVCEKIGENKFKIKRVDFNELRKQFAEIQKNESELLSFIYKILKREKEEFSLLHYAKKAKVFSQKFSFPITPFHLLLAQSNTLRIIQSNNGHTIQLLDIKPKNSVKKERTSEEIEMNDLLKQMKNPYSESYLKAKMIYSLNEKNEVDVEVILNELFPMAGTPFAGNEEELFQKLFEDLMTDMMQIHYRKKLKEHHLELITSTVKVKENAVDMVRRTGMVSYFMFETETDLYQTFIQLNDALDKLLQLGLNYETSVEEVKNALTILEKVERNMTQLEHELP